MADRKFMVIAISTIHSSAISLLTDKGWQELTAGPINGKVKTFSSKDACAERDAAMESTINRYYRFVIAEIAA